MKKMLLSGIACFVALSVVLPAEAAQIQPTCSIGGCNAGDCFMDADGDGMCGDHCFLDENGDGICDNHCYTDEDENGVCDFFTDEDSDGICDHCHEHGKTVKNTQSAARSTGCHGSNQRRGHHGRHH